MKKSIHSNYTKSLCFILLVLASFLTISATVHYDYVTIDGFEYEIIYDDVTGTGAASLFTRAWDYETEEWYSIQYEEWNTDSIYAIPSTVGYFPVTAIYGGFAGFSDIKTIIVPPTVTKIGRDAFSKSSLESIYFAYDNDGTPIIFAEFEPGPFDDEESVSSVSCGEFSNCERLKTVEFQRPINKFSPGMFLNCSKLETVFFNPSYVNSNNLSLDTIEPCAFFGCEGLAHFEMPKSVKVIGEGAFAHCHGLETIDISSITSVGDYAFAECYQLQDVTLNPSLNYLGEAAFLNCKSLTSMSIPDAITVIRDHTFYNCCNLADLNLNNVTTFGERSFAGCNKLTEIDLTKAQSIGLCAFFGGEVSCVVSTSPSGYGHLSISLREEGWGTQETTLGSVKKITLGENVTLLEDRTFVGHVPDTITCWSPAPPTFTVTTNYNWTFSTQAYDTTVLRVPRVLVNDYREAFCWSRFVNIEGMTVFGNGDVNGDGQLSISDVTALIDMLLNGQAGTSNPVNADMNGDGRLSVGDITRLIDRLLNGE